MEVVASLSHGRTAAAQCGLFTHKSVPVIFEPPCILLNLVCMSCRPILYSFCFIVIAEFLRFCICEIYIFSLLGFSFSLFIHACHIVVSFFLGLAVYHLKTESVSF